MNFSSTSDVTVVLTSCGRFDLLKKTLDSFDLNNTYPIKKVIITEDSGDSDIFSVIPQSWLPFTEIIINNPKLGQMKSIDLAYSKVETPYIFHCEDDWLFYRKGFIEDSLSVLDQNENILQVWLRDYHNDVKLYYPFHYLGLEREINQISFSELESKDKNWRGFSLNPGLRRLSDYQKISPYFNNKSADIRESEISVYYYNIGMKIAILKNSAIEHIGWEDHILTESEQSYLREKSNKKRKKYKHIFLGMLIGSFLTFCFFYFFMIFNS